MKTISHHTALVYVMVVVSAADGAMSDKELKAIGDLTRTLPVFKDFDRDRLLVLANLSPPAGPAMPGAFDFQRVAWFQAIGGVGAPLIALVRPRLEQELREDVVGEDAAPGGADSDGSKLAKALNTDG